MTLDGLRHEGEIDMHHVVPFGGGGVIWCPLDLTHPFMGSGPKSIFTQKLDPGVQLTIVKVWNRYLFFFSELTGQFYTHAEQQQNHRVAKFVPMLQNEMDSLTQRKLRSSKYLKIL